MIRITFEALHFFEHGFTGDIEDAPGDDAARLAAGMGVYGGDEAGKAQEMASGYRSAVKRISRATGVTHFCVPWPGSGFTVT